MMKRWSLLVILMFALVAFTGCSDDDDPVNPGGGDTAFDVMVAAGKAYINDSLDCPGTISAGDLYAALDDYTVIDVRSYATYEAGHIPGAYWTDWDSFLDDLANNIPSDKPYVVTCYSGQSAGHYKIAAELMGYENFKTLAWGMNSWSPTTATGWPVSVGNVGDKLADLGYTVETTNNNGDLVENDFPVLTESTSTVVADRVAAMLAGGFKSIRFSDMHAAGLENYFILNYFGPGDYDGTSGVTPGHIPGAFQFTPYTSLADDQMLKNLPSDGTTIVVYCWTGQHSSQVTAYLNMLGYNAKSLSYGSNGLFYSELTGHKWVDTNVNDYPLEMGAMMTGDFAALVDAGDDYINDSADCPGTISASALYTDLSEYTVIDVRSQTAYDTGHIAGAYWTDWTHFVDDMANNIPSDKPYVFACYSGQSAGHYKFCAEMLGYENVKTLAWGMSSWNAAAATSWTDNANDTAGNVLTDLGYTAETTNNNENLDWHPYPTTTGSVEERVASVLAGGFKSTSLATMHAGGLENYFILNYFGVGDYDGTSGATPGHIPGAFQFTPYASLGAGEWLGHLPSDGTTIVVYCWTGQHSSQVTAYLNYLGYNAVSLSFGSNKLFYTDLTSHKWTEANVNSYPLEATPIN